VDESLLEWETVLVSAGRRGLQIELAPRDLIELTGATVAALTSPTRSSPQ
jgi:Cys-tRNA(Pro)/Cys-tRNA(Cys) deacylase